MAGRLRGEIDSTQVRYGVTAYRVTYRVTYRTSDSAGSPTTASQLVVLPRSGARDLPVVSWLHGTTVYRKDVASGNPESNDRLVALLLASTGRAVSAPDYVGLGSGEGFHPYGDPRATVAASVDGLRAARTVAHRNGRELQRNVQVSGFSQGGSATMLVGRALQQKDTDRYFRLGPSPRSAAPTTSPPSRPPQPTTGSGTPASTWPTWPPPGTGCTASTPHPAMPSSPPYAGDVEDLFGGYHTTEEIAHALPATSEALFTEAFLNSPG
ncbi:lipase family protein [Kitasatospora sp. NPDC059973]|uniref:lipase family protein n=1 Tax=Kitasatospora sp. NPDC059973 TaxID=3347020 RepID=UPI0036ACC990